MRKTITQSHKVELDSLKQNGLLAPKDVVKAAQDPANPLHDLFTWDNDAAGDKYRLKEAQTVISAYYVLIPSNPTRPQRKYVSLAPDRIQGKGYRDISNVQRSTALKQSYLETALADALEFADRYVAIQEWDIVRKAIISAVARARIAAGI